MDLNHHKRCTPHKVITDHWRRITTSMVTKTKKCREYVEITGDLFIKMNGKEQLRKGVHLIISLPSDFDDLGTYEGLDEQN